MALGNVAVGEQRSWFLAVGLQDNTVRIISLDPSDCLAPRSMQALPAAAESLCIVEMGVKDADSSEDSAPQQSSLYLNIGKVVFPFIVVTIQRCTCHYAAIRLCIVRFNSNTFSVSPLPFALFHRFAERRVT